MKRKTVEVMLRLFLVASAASTAHGQELDDSRFTLRGFGTVAATTHDAEGLEYRRSVGQANGVASGDVELFTDSVAGLQFNARLSPNFDFVVQGVTHQHSDGSWKPDVSQAFVRFSPDQSWALRAGRIGYDIYLLAESRQVGYSYLALRPSPEIYGLVTNDSIDGGDFAYTHRMGTGLLRARVFGGKGIGENAFADGSHRDVDTHVYGAIFDYLYRGWTARLAWLTLSLDADPGFAQLAAGLRLTGVPQSLALADTLDDPTLRFRGMQLGIAYEEGPLQAQVLLGATDSNSLSGPDTYTLYSLLGYRFGAFTPYASYANARDRESIRSTGLPDLPMFAPLNDGVEAVQMAIRATQHTTSAGLRYDFNSHLDLKLQVDFVALRGSSLMFDRRSPAGGPADMTVIGASIDFVF